MLNASFKDNSKNGTNLTSGCTHYPIGILVGRRTKTQGAEKRVRILNTESYEVDSREIERKAGSWV